MPVRELAIVVMAGKRTLQRRCTLGTALAVWVGGDRRIFELGKYWFYRTYRESTAATAPPPVPRRRRRVQRRAARFTTHHRLRR